MKYTHGLKHAQISSYTSNILKYLIERGRSLWNSQILIKYFSDITLFEELSSDLSNHEDTSHANGLKYLHLANFTFRENIVQKNLAYLSYIINLVDRNDLGQRLLPRICENQAV